MVIFGLLLLADAVAVGVHDEGAGLRRGWFVNVVAVPGVRFLVGEVGAFFGMLRPVVRIGELSGYPCQVHQPFLSRVVVAFREAFRRPACNPVIGPDYLPQVRLAGRQRQHPEMGVGRKTCGAGHLVTVELVFMVFHIA